MAHDSTSFRVGQPFPAFSLPAVLARSDGELETVTLDNAAFAGQSFVLFVYPRDATSGCTLEACGFRELYPRFQELGVAIVGLSRDGLGPHRRFIANQQLPYPLLSDEKGPWLSEHGLIYQASMYGKAVSKVARTSFWVNGDGVVQHIWEKVSPPGHAEEVLEHLQSAAASRADSHTSA